MADVTGPAGNDRHSLYMGTFERDVRKTDGRDGGADVWMKGHLGWEFTSGF